MQVQSPEMMIGRSAWMRTVIERIETIAPSQSTVLISGETGVGKEVLTEYIHRRSSRAHMPLLKIGLATLPRELLESELFGHERGAYTSAISEKKGLFELADCGTIFLDDIDDFPYNLQSKLLRVIEDGSVLRVGGTKAIRTDVRIICATKVDLMELVEAERFREDLYYRIHVIPITIPPLRERRADILPLAEHFLRIYGNGKKLSLCDNAKIILEQHSWPGNIREVRNVMERIALFADETIHPDDIPGEIRSRETYSRIIKACHRCFMGDHLSFDEVISCVEINLIQQALRQNQGNRTQAAKSLKMNFSRFRDKLKKYGISPEELDS